MFHGCPQCFPEDREETKHPLTQQSMSELYALTQKKKAYVEYQGMKYVCVWEHEFREACQGNSELRHFIQNLDVTDGLDPRDSFFGGRTNASQLYYIAREIEQIKYVDFTSLYHFVKKTCEYPWATQKGLRQTLKTSISTSESPRSEYYRLVDSTIPCYHTDQTES